MFNFLDSSVCHITHWTFPCRHQGIGYRQIYNLSAVCVILVLLSDAKNERSRNAEQSLRSIAYVGPKSRRSFNGRRHCRTFFGFCFIYIFPLLWELAQYWSIDWTLFVCFSIFFALHLTYFGNECTLRDTE